MAKKPIEWHEDCYRNQAQYHHSLIDKMQQAQAAVDRSQRDLILYDRQIKEAKRRNLAEFDRDKLKPEMD